MPEPITMTAAAIFVLERLGHHAITEGGKELVKAYGEGVDRRAAQKLTNRGMAAWVQKHNYVFFDFSDWAVDDLNMRTTSRVFGIPSGTLIVKANDSSGKIECSGTFDTLVGSDIVWLYKWCRENAPGTSDRQRRFRFEGSKYAGEGSVRTVWKVGATVVAGLFLGIVAG